MNKIICMMLGLMATGLAVAKLPSLSADAAATAVEAKAKAAWSSKVAEYKLCMAQDKVVARYRQEKSTSEQATDATSSCSDPGPYVVASPVAANLSTAPAGLPVATDAAATPKK